jgi:hypothetical protein
MALPPHIPLAVRIFPHLAECASQGKRTNVDELSQYVNGETRLFNKSLSWIRDYLCVEHNLPLITVIVQNNGKDTPSNSFAPSKLTALNKEQYDQLRNETLEKVYAYPRWIPVSEALKRMFE